ncbi:hypothetical protein ACFL3V_07110 [Nanoarchaeota archaeon]
MRPRKKRAGRRLKKKSQTEIMGLMIVVILLIVGVLFAIKFVVLKKPPQLRQTFSRTQMASNMGLALMSSTTQNCRGTAIKDLLIDCAEWPEAGGTITCDPDPETGFSLKSCDYVNNTILDIANKTLDAWWVDYYITAGTKEVQTLSTNNDCDPGETQPGESESFFLPTSRGLLTLKIFICE